MTLAHHPVFVVLAAAAPLLTQIPGVGRLPVVVLEVFLIGPDAFLSAMEAAGIATVLFMAGMEIDFERIRGRPLTLGLAGWALSLAIAGLIVALLHIVPGVRPVPTWQRRMRRERAPHKHFSLYVLHPSTINPLRVWEFRALTEDDAPRPQGPGGFGIEAARRA